MAFAATAFGMKPYDWSYVDPEPRKRVINLRDYQVIGRGGRRGRVVCLPDDVARIDRLTRWGNPFRIGPRNCTHPDCGPDSHRKVTREQAIASYRSWLAGLLVVDPDFLEPLRGKRLACWCAPLPCHGDVIAELIP